MTTKTIHWTQEQIDSILDNDPYRVLLAFSPAELVEMLYSAVDKLDEERFYSRYEADRLLAMIDRVEDRVAEAISNHIKTKNELGDRLEAAYDEIRDLTEKLAAAKHDLDLLRIQGWV